MKIAILTDSSYGGDSKKYDNLFVMPLMITKENGEQVYDNESLSDEEFYDALQNQVLKTSQTITGDIINTFSKLLKEYDQVIVLLLSKGLSGQYRTALFVSEDMEEFKDKIFIPDTNGVSVILEHLIDRAHDLIKQGKTAQEIFDYIESKNNKFRGFIIPKNLDTLVRGGRISKGAAALARMLKINPILRYDGTIDKFSKERTFKKAVKTALEQLKTEIPGLESIDLTYSRSGKEEIELVHNLIKEANLKIKLESKLSKVVTAHTGTETFAFMAWEKEEV